MKQLRIIWVLKGQSQVHIGDWDDASNYTIGELNRMQRILDDCCSSWQLDWR